MRPNAFVRSQRVRSHINREVLEVKRIFAAQQKTRLRSRPQPMINLACGISVSVVIIPKCALLAAGRGGVLLSAGLGVASVQMAHYDNEGSKPLAQTSATGKVKWFNGTKGYGF